MNRKSFIVRCALVVVAVLFPWKSVSAKTTFAEIASRFQWDCIFLPLGIDREVIRPLYLVTCWGQFQDGKDYQCAEYVDLLSNYVDQEYTQGVNEETDPEAILSEIATNFNKAMRTRFNQLNGHFDINAYGAYVDDRAQSS